MGIRFHCPNGHKLNVKSDLAGKRAICPECGAKLVVPGVASQRVSEPAMSSAIGLPLAMPSSIGVRVPTPQTATTVSAIAPPVSAWYVRPKGGGQFGPATDEVFRAWISEGRVEADAHVWRNGWTDWKLVRDAADALPAPLAAAAAVAPPAVVRPAVIPIAKSAPAGLQPLEPATLADAESVELPEVGEEAMMPASRYRASRQRANKLQITLAILMLAAILVLAGVLVWVLRRGETPVESPSEAAVGTRSIQLADSLAGAYVAGVCFRLTSLTDSNRVSLERLTYGNRS